MKAIKLTIILIFFIGALSNNVFFSSCESPDNSIPSDTIPNDTIPNDTIPNDTIPNDTIPITPITYDTIKPKNYFPVYPGSWWKYEINDTGYITTSVSPLYKLHSYLSSTANYIDVYSDTLYVPFLSGNPIYGYNKIEYISPPFGGYYTKWPILSETVGYEFNRGFTDYRHGDINEHVKVIQKIIRNNDSIIILKGHWVPNEFNMEGGDLNNISIQEYKKYVGLTDYYIIDTTIQDTIYKKVLVDYFINK